MIQITQGGVKAEPDAIARLTLDFRERGVATMPRFLAPPVLSTLLKSVETARFDFVKEPYVEGATLFMPLSDPAQLLLHFIVNRPELFEVVSRITGIPRPGNFTSRLHRTTPAPGQYIDWHDDGTDYRVLGLNINLSTRPYTGGLLQMRNPQGEIVAEVGQLAAGDAFLFRIGGRWLHRLTPVESGERTVAVGWFRSKPDWTLALRAGLQTSRIVLEATAHQ